MHFCSIVCAVSLSASIQLLISFFVIILVSIIWNRHHDPRISPPEMASLPMPAPTSSPELSPPPSHPEQPDQVKEKKEKEKYPVVRLPYSEDIIVTLVSDIYRIYVQLGYMNNRADGMEEIAWPPPGGHAINEAICQELNLSPKVISLMRRLPYPVSYHIAAELPFKEWSTAFAYIEDRQIRDGRDPGRWIFDTPRTDFLLPHEIALAGADDEGIHLILDTQENTIRAVDWQQLEDEDGNADFRALPAQHAPAFFAEYVDKLRSLEIIPGGQGSCVNFYEQEHHSAVCGLSLLFMLVLAREEANICLFRSVQHPMIKKVLQEQYGWPYDFRETEWKAAARDTLKRLGQLYPS
ncbi:uncharacterized protein BO66DRAFT_449983 [Aspergillus aculeatinus CBS 121060]|uniref:Uncharacterized protein n=1 Tax=Aspergillus aculeatinus CBS 121060 TaxID=1448322 RepID=A0ACD1HN47_9EURO|nr:hypothetical protein BO66DRAFT_449983 [Aspergillus aculeatinus CBS 121060]RAH75035.1 hypothetical protein BO66DRAFT_449983 [Aspergillus aculeatinus CBS 121060]